MSQPTPKQLSYLTALIARSGMTREQWEDSVGLREHSPWGVRFRSENVTRAAVSVWIDRLIASQREQKAGACQGQTGSGEMGQS